MPVTIGLVAAGTQALGGAAQSIFSGRGKAESDLNAFATKSPLAQESKSLNDYYQQALNRYQENPYQSAQYMTAQRNADRSLASRLNLGQDLGSSLSMAGKANAQYNDTLGQAGAQAEAQRSQRFGQLGQASQAKAAQDKYLFDVNQMTPYNRQLQLKQLASQAANERYNAGIQMVGGALGNAAQIGAMSAYNKPVTQQPQMGISSQSTFNSWTDNPSLKPSINPSYIQHTQGLPQRNQYISGATPYFPKAY